MNKNLWLKIINPILLILIVSQAFTGLFHHSIPDELFEIIHEGGGIALIIVSLIHLVLNWNWVYANYIKRTHA